MDEKKESNAIIWGIGGVVLLVALAAHGCMPDKTQSSAPVVAPQATAVDLSALNRSIPASISATGNRLYFAEADGRKFRAYLEYGAEPRNMAQVASDSEAAMKAVLEAIKSTGVDPWSGGTFVSLYAQRPDGDVAGKPMIRRYGRTSFSAISGKIEFEPAE